MGGRHDTSVVSECVNCKVYNVTNTYVFIYYIRYIYIERDILNMFDSIRGFTCMFLLKSVSFST